MNLFLGTLSLAVILAALSPSPTWAAEITRTSKPGSSDDAEDENAGEDIDEGTMTRNQAPPIEDLPDEEARNTLREVLTEQAGLAFAPIVYRGAEILQLQPEFVQGARQGLELIYLRNYAGAMEHFGQMDEEYPGSALGPVGRGLIFQAKMLENFDFDYEPQYETNWRAAKSQLLTAIETPGNEAWEYFLMVGVVGVEAIHATRKYNYVGALSKALEAMRYLERSREEAPDFPDLVLADGINNYWRSVIAMNTKLIPDGEDTRAEGISQMKYVETHGIFLSAPTSLALTFSYLEERDVKRAVATSFRVHRSYPENIINNLVLARIYMYMRRYTRSETICNAILETDPKNERAHYYLGLVYSRSKRLDQAITEMELYLSYDLIDEYRATSLYRLAGFVYRKKDYARAEQLYKDAYKVNKHKGAKRRLARMKRMKKEGRIDY